LKLVVLSLLNGDIDAGAIEVHGISNEFLLDKPKFADIVDDFIDFIKGAELVIHNAPFDVGFINSELLLLDAGAKSVDKICGVLDTLVLAREIHPGQRNSLDALCKRYDIDNSRREKHGALLDAEILADVFLAMTGGQTDLLLDATVADNGKNKAASLVNKKLDIAGLDQLRIIKASEEEQKAHQQKLEKINKASNGQCLWLRGDM